MTDSPHRIDEALRQVPLPPELMAAVTADALFADAALDRLVGRVAVPAGLVDRVRAAARAGRADGVVDLSRVAVGVAQPPTRVGRRPAARLSALVREAASVAAALGLVIVLAKGGVEFSRRLEQPAVAKRNDLAKAGPASPPALGPAAARAVAPARVVDRAESPPAASPAETRSLAASDDGPSIPPGADAAPETAAEVPPGPAAGERTVRGAPVWSTDLAGQPMMSTVQPPRDVRRVVPRSPAFDMAFEMARGEAPFVEPSADPKLALDRPPLTLRTDGFDDLLGFGPRRGAVRPRIRAEEILAAMPTPPGLANGRGAVRVGLHVVRSGRTVSGAPTLLLEAAVFAAGDDLSGGPLRATLLLDQSAAGDRRGWPRICRAVTALADRLRPEDRVSVVLCGPSPRVALRAERPALLAAAAADWEGLPAAASADLDAALDLAAEENLLQSRVVVVAHAVTLDAGRATVRRRLADWHGALAAAGGDPLTSTPPGCPRFIVVDPTATAAGGPEEPTFGRTAIDAVAIRRELARQVTGRDTLVARHCRMEIRFDPRRVLRYRIVGHQQSAVESLAADPPPAIDLHAGETARVVYEVVPRGSGGTGLATARLTWRGDGDGLSSAEAADHDSRDRGEGLPSVHGCELLLAAGIGDCVGGSVHEPQPRRRLASIGRVATDWKARGDVSSFGESLLGTLDGRSPDQPPTR